MRKIAAGLALAAMCVAQTAAGQDVIFLKCTLEGTQARFASALTRNRAKMDLSGQIFRDYSIRNSKPYYFRIEIRRKNLLLFEKETGKYNCSDDMCTSYSNDVIFQIDEDYIDFQKISDHLVRMQPKKEIIDHLFSNNT